MINQQNNYAYIDGANLNNALKELGWLLDYKRFRVWLSDKYAVERAYIFIGFIPRYEKLYTYLQSAGFTLIFKEVIYDGSGKAKGNCDADLVLRAVSDYYENNFNKIILVSSDGDYAGLVKFFKEQQVLNCVISPSNKCSYLLRKLNISLVYLSTQKLKLKLLPKKEKAPDKDETS